MNDVTTVEFPAALEHLAAIRRIVGGWCDRAGASPEDRHAVVLAVDEACTNVIEHGYLGIEGGTLRLDVHVSGDEIRVALRDSGRAFDPDDAPSPDLAAGWRERPIGGLGWHLIRGMVDEVRYRSEASGNQLTLVKRLTKEPTTGAT